MSGVAKTATAEEWKRFSIDLLTSVGMFAAEAEISVERMLDAELWNLDHDGLSNLPSAIVAGDSGDMDVRAQLQVLSETPAMVMVNGHQASGRLVASRAVDMILKKLPESGVVAIGIKNSQPLGSPSVYSAMLADAGYIGCCATNTGDSAVSTFGSSAVNFFGTNKMGWAYPVSDEELLVYSQGVHTNGGIAESFFPAETSQLSQAFATFSIATLAGPLQAGKYSVNKTKGANIEQTQHFLLAFDPERFGGKAKFQKELMTTIDKLEESGEPSLKMNLRKTTKCRVLPESITVNFSQQGWDVIARQVDKGRITSLVEA